MSFDRIPNEILSSILVFVKEDSSEGDSRVKEVQGATGLKSLALACRRLYNLTMPMRFSHVDVNPPSARNATHPYWLQSYERRTAPRLRLGLILRSVLQNPGLGDCIRTLTIESFESDAHPSSSKKIVRYYKPADWKCVRAIIKAVAGFGTDEVCASRILASKWYKDVRGGHADALNGLLLAVLPGVKILNVNFDYWGQNFGRRPVKPFDYTPFALSLAREAPNNQQQVSRQSRHFRSSIAEEGILPSLNEITIRGVQAIDTIQQYLDVPQLVRAEVYLDGERRCFYHEKPIFFGPLPKLKHLKWVQWRSEFESMTVLEKLLKVANKLQCFIFDHHYDPYDTEDMDSDLGSDFGSDWDSDDDIEERNGFMKFALLQDEAEQCATMLSNLVTYNPLIADLEIVAPYAPICLADNLKDLKNLKTLRTLGLHLIPYMKRNRQSTDHDEISLLKSLPSSLEALYLRCPGGWVFHVEECTCAVLLGEKLALEKLREFIVCGGDDSPKLKKLRLGVYCSEERGAGLNALLFPTVLAARVELEKACAAKGITDITFVRPYDRAALL